MEVWQTILLAITGNTIAIAALAWLAKAFVTNQLQRDLETHRATLEKENQSAVESLRHELSLVAHKQNLITSKLHEKQGEVIASIFAQLENVASLGRSYTTPVEIGGEPTKSEKYQLFADAYNSLSLYFSENSLYLPKSICERMNALLDGIRAKAVALNIAFRVAEDMKDRDSFRRKHEAWSDSWKYFIDELPKVKSELDSEFRLLIGSA